jgi:hypothetical protein
MYRRIMRRTAQGRTLWVGGLVDPQDGSAPHVVPPVVFDTDGKLVMGAEVLAEVKKTGEGQDVPIIRNANPAVVADLERFLASVCEQLGVTM